MRRNLVHDGLHGAEAIVAQAEETVSDPCCVAIRNADSATEREASDRIRSVITDCGKLFAALRLSEGRCALARQRARQAHKLRSADAVQAQRHENCRQVVNLCGR
jgi:hypothetical protein